VLSDVWRVWWNSNNLSYTEGNLCLNL